MFVAETIGYGSTGLSPEEVAANWAAINDETGYLVPADLGVYTTHFAGRVPK
jgi:hypothetical protein